MSLKKGEMFYRKRMYYPVTFAPVVLVILLLPAYLWAFQNEPDGFRGIKWETGIAELPDMILAEESSDTKYYHRKDDTLKIGQATIERLAYGFYKGKFFLVLIEFKDMSNFSNIKETFSRLYGEGERRSTLLEDYSWHGDAVDIILQYLGISKVGYAAYWFKPIARQRETDKKERFRQGAKDL